ncbi:Alpha-(1,3)-fucosyltransferase 11 [Mortierella alpina]|nr:Alpha-(1,3)-fucosyltransferase 11 [Mortierella alpina]
MSTPAKEYPLLWWKQEGRDGIDGWLVDGCDLPYTCRHSLNESHWDQSPLVLVNVFQVGHDADNGLPPQKEFDAGKKALIFYGAEAPKDFERDPKIMARFTYKFTFNPTADYVTPYFGSNTIDMVLEPPPVSLEHKNTMRKQGFVNSGGRGLAPIAWIVSNCHSFNGRHLYVHQLQKYIDIDIYGHCNPTRPWPKDADNKDLTPEQIVTQYKFYLAFENSNCDYYVTEKLQRAYKAAAIPIVDGPKDYSVFAATRTALIQTDDHTPKSLARLVEELDRNDDLYRGRISYKYPKNPLHRPTTKDLSPYFVRTWASPDSNSTKEGTSRRAWSPSYEESICRVCELAHDVSEGLVQLDPMQRLQADTTCVLRKHYHVTWFIEYHWRIAVAILTSIAVLVYLLTRPPVKKLWMPLVQSVLPHRWRQASNTYVELPTIKDDLVN